MVKNLKQTDLGGKKLQAVDTSAMRDDSSAETVRGGPTRLFGLRCWVAAGLCMVACNSASPARGGGGAAGAGERSTEGGLGGGAGMTAAGGAAGGGTGYCYDTGGLATFPCGPGQYCAYYTSIGSGLVNECRPFPDACRSCQCAVADTKAIAALRIQNGVSVDWASCSCLDANNTSIDIDSSAPITSTFCVIP